MPTRTNKSYGWIKREGKLGGPGYTKKTTAARHRILAGVVKKYGYRSALGSIMALERSTQISATVRKVLVSDRVWLRETYGAASKKALTAAKKTAAQKRAKKTTPRRVPSVARRTRRVKAAARRIPKSTWSAARGSSYPTRKPGESDQAFARRINAWTLGGVKDATRRHKAKYPGFAAWMKKQPKQRGGYNRLGEYVDLNTGGSILTPGDYRDKYAREVKGEAYARYNPRLPQGSTRVDTIMVRGEPFADVYENTRKVDGMSDTRYIAFVRSTGEQLDKIARSPRGLIATAKALAEDAGLLKPRKGAKRSVTRKSVYLQSEVATAFVKKPEYEDRKKHMLRNGRAECGYHGVPTIRGECVVCAYEADVR